MALRHGWLDRLPDFSQPYRSSVKILHRAWFSPEEYEQLYQATRRRALDPKKRGFSWEAEQLHDYVLFAANTGLRPDEARRLEFRDVKIVDDADIGKTILEIEVRGKRGVGYCKSMPGAVRPLERLKNRLRPPRVDGVRVPIETSDPSCVLKDQWRLPGPTDLIFPKSQRESLRQSLKRKTFAPIAKVNRVRRTVYGTRISADG
jgi:integrase